MTSVLKISNKKTLVGDYLTPGQEPENVRSAVTYAHDKRE